MPPGNSSSLILAELGIRQAQAGRPPKMGKPVEAGIKVNLTLEDRQSLDLEAERRGIGPSELARDLILKSLRRSKDRRKKQK